MVVPIDIVLYASIGLFLLSLALTKKRTSSLAIFWSAAAATLFIGEYALSWSLGGSNLSVRILFIQVPLWYLVILPGANIWLLSTSSKVKGFAVVAAFALAYVEGLNRPFEGHLYMVGVQIPAANYLIVQMLYSVSLFVSTGAPMGACTEFNLRPAGRWLLIGFKKIKRDVRVLMIAGLAYVAVLAITNLIFKSRAFGFYLPVPLTDDIRGVVEYICFVSLIDHWLSFGMAKWIIDKLFPGDAGSRLEWILYAGLYTGLHSYFKPQLLVREFLFGLVYSYVFVRTGTLSYGVIWQTIVFSFTF